MAKLSPKIEIINHFDNLIHRIDIDIDKTIENYKEDQVLGELKFFPIKERNFFLFPIFLITYFDSNKSSENKNCERVIEWSESIKVIDYLNQVRQRTISELRKAQEDSLEYLKSQSCDLNHIKESKDVDEMKSRLFGDKFYFQLISKNNFEDLWVFNLYTIVVDFYLSPSDINCLELLFNYKGFDTELDFENSIQILDEKFVLILSLAKSFYETMKTQQYPSHLISFRKQDLLNIKDIVVWFINIREVNFNCSSNYLSKLESLEINVNVDATNSDATSFIERVRIEGLSSLKSLLLSLKSLEGNSFGNLNSLKQLTLYFESKINNEMLTKLFEIFPNIEKLYLIGDFSNISFDSFVNLKKLKLCGYHLDDFNFDVFKNICYQFEKLSIKIKNMDNESIFKLFYGHNFPNLSKLNISCNKITRLEKKLFDGFPMLQRLKVSKNGKLKTIDTDAFSNLKNLKKFKIEYSYQLTELQPELFSNLGNLEELDLTLMKLTHFDLKIFNYIVNIKKIKLCDRSLKNKEEILDHLKKSNIKF